MVQLKQQIAAKKNYGTKRNVSNIKYIVIHYTGNDGDSDESNAKYFQKKIIEASAHYFVDDDSITQSVPDDYNAYAVGGKKWNNSGGRLYGTANNSNSISIELCDTVKNGKVYPTQKTINNAIELTQHLMRKYNIPAHRVIRHYDVNGKNCVPMYTEVLTREGWKFISEVNIGDEIMTAHIDDMSLNYAPILDIVAPYTTRTYSMNGITLTANHRVVYQTDIGRTFKIDTWQEIMNKKQSLIPTCGQLKSSGIDINDDMIKLLVAIQADGYYERNDLLHFHLKKERKINRLEELLSNLDIVYKKEFKSDGSVSIRIRDKDNDWFYCYFFEDMNLLQNKIFTFNLLKMNKNQADIFFNELLYWDGNYTEKDDYFSMIKQNCDLVSAVACCNNVKVTQTQTKKGLWIVHFKKDNLSVGKTFLKKVKKSQLVTCVTVPSGIFIVRQNGHIFITGNCPLYWINDNLWEQEFHSKIGGYIAPSGQDINPFKEPTKQITSKAIAQSKGIANFESQGEGVKWMQWELSKVSPAYNNFLNLHGGIDGKCGKNTTDLLILFQQSYGLEPDGVCGSKTRTALKAN